eukprot:SAG31_NODE_27421_length_426_cov_0.905199_1_plen_62_part_01
MTCTHLQRRSSATNADRTYCNGTEQNLDLYVQVVPPDQNRGKYQHGLYERQARQCVFAHDII